MRHEEGRFAGVGGLQLYWRGWLPDAASLDPAPQAVLALVHGVGEHSGRYRNLVGPLVEGGYPVYGYDQRGHGRSPGPRGHIERWADYRGDLRAFLGLVVQHAPGRPLVLYGHSMGSLVVLDYLLQRPVGLAGAIVSGVALQPTGVGKPYQLATARVSRPRDPTRTSPHERRCAGGPRASPRCAASRPAWRPSTCRCSCSTAAPTR
jgi:alpha-beta hydrolase superfamily lysophospholipase